MLAEVERHARVMSLFDSAVDLGDAEREDFLARIGDEALASEVRSLLRFVSSGGDKPGLAATGDGLAAFADALAAPPDTGGRFQVKKLLGQGGMGAVYLAEQKKPRRLVALKVLRADLASEKYHRRFAAEGEILARLSHPGIARVFEAIDGPKPYLVMELIDGVPLTTWTGIHNPDLRRRVELLIAIAEAVDHAHRSGVVHRDLKPGNILVTPAGAPKVLDFGIARVVDEERQDGATMTRAGEVLGTPAYMSPEQTGLDSLGVDHRADVYTLGVIAYELLTGSLPYQIDSDLIGNMINIREVVPVLAGRHDKALRGDLEVILQKALAKARAERYPSAAAFAEDLGRWLRAEPILARPPSVIYQIGRFARRNRALFAAFSALFVALVVGAVVSTALWLEGRETQAELRRRVDDLVLLQARATLEADPTAAVASLTSLSPDADWSRAYALAWDARARGVSEHVLVGHEADVEWVAVANDGAIASASFDGTVRVWRGDAAEVLRGHTGGVNRVAWSARGVLASAGRDGALIVWQGGRGSVRHRHAGPCEDLAWSPDGATLVSVGGDGALVRVGPDDEVAKEVALSRGPLVDVEWRGATIAAGGELGELIVIEGAAAPMTIALSAAEIDQVALAPGDPPLIAGAAVDGELSLWSREGGVRRLQGPGAAAMKGIAFVDRERLAAVDRGGALTLWDVGDGEAHVLAQGGSVYRDVAVSDDHAWLATAGDDRTVWLRDLVTLEPLAFRGHRDATLSLAFTPDGHLVSSSKDGDLRVWPLPRERTRWALSAPLRTVGAHGGALAVVDESGHLGRVDLDSGRFIEVGRGDDGYLAVWAPDGASFLTARRDGSVHVRTRAGVVTRTFMVDGRAIAFAFQADGARFAALTNDGVLVIADAAGESYEVLSGERANALTFVGDAIVTVHRDGRVLKIARDGTEWRESQLATVPGEAMHVVANERWLVAAGSDRAQRWRVADWTEAGATTHAGPIHALALDGDRFASGGRDGVVKLWSEGERAFTGHAGAVSALALTGDTLISGGRDRTVRIWHLAADAGAPQVPPQVIDLFDGPIKSVVLAASRPSGPLDRIVVVADAPVLTVWPLDIPRAEAPVRAWIAALLGKVR